MNTYIEPEQVIRSLTAAQLLKLWSESSNFMYKLLCDTGSLSKIEKAEKDFAKWKETHGFDHRSHIEEITAAIEEKTNSLAAGLQKKLSSAQTAALASLFYTAPKSIQHNSKGGFTDPHALHSKHFSQKTMEELQNLQLCTIDKQGAKITAEGTIVYPKLS